ncbi:hypothetical protein CHINAEXTREME_12320 [Halobiforma lacisalsi AJ5]|uniref:Uncharacterized protein n=1 Tax=Natronobacterium lacisalsi AJ5 TaxID=358396 RepID=M0LJQ8_NATLA|nr:hypothetical protein [Halobiforma lacisalsi]APW98510.1 hypothetical protein CHINAEXTREME_12320 [Halobiforma lacisalsi AJ5]EMA33293.1 hypothetical protein C445_09613 [Halobiforma lacisalsi AJ5]
MDTRDRLIVGTLWIAVAALIATTLESAVPDSAVGVVQLFVVALALFLAVLYLFDPWDVISNRQFH